MKIFVPLIGQHENIGDVVLRRELVEWLTPLGQLHVYVGASSIAYDRALELPNDAVIYKHVTSWARALAGVLRTGRGLAYVYKPGEIQLTIPGLKEHVGLLPLVVATRLRGGTVIRVGSGSRNFGRLPTMVLRSTLKLSNFTAWRDTRTASVMGLGSVMPDLGFGQVGRSLASELERNRLTVSMRGDRSAPSETWKNAVLSTAANLGLQLTVVTQVERDESTSYQLANELNAEYVPWRGRDHTEQENAVRRIYDESLLVVSDRLHTLIVAVTEGAAVATVADCPTDKVQRHFSAARVPILSMDSSKSSRFEIQDAMAQAAWGREAQQEALKDSIVALDEVRQSVVQSIRGAHD